MRDIYFVMRQRIERVDAELRAAADGKTADEITLEAEGAFKTAGAVFSTSALLEYAVAVASGEPYELFI